MLTGTCDASATFSSHENYMPSHAKGKLDLIGFDGDTLAIVEVRTRLADKTRPAMPELSISREKHEVLVGTARLFCSRMPVEGLSVAV